MTNQAAMPPSDQDQPPAATEFTLLLEESSEAAVVEGISETDLDEMDAINQMRIVAEAIASDDYIFHTSS